MIESVIKSVATVKKNSVDAMHAMQGTLQTMTASLAPLTNMKVEMLAAMKDMFSQHSIKQVCDSRPRPTPRALQNSTMNKCPEKMRAPPTHVGTAAPTGTRPPPSGFG